MSTWSVDITNIAGIRSGQATFEPGVNVVQAENWQGKSSLLAALQTVMGTTGMESARHPLTEGAAQGSVRLDTGAETYEVHLEQGSGDAVHRSGTPFLEADADRMRAHLFAFLGETNPVRAAVRNQEDLGDLLTKPLEMEDIEEQIADLKRERRELESEIEQATAATAERPTVQESVTQLEADLEDLRAHRQELRAELDDEDLADLRDELGERRADLASVESDVERIRNKIERQETRLEEKRDQLDAIGEIEEPTFDADVAETRERVNRLRTQVELLEDLYSVNKRVLDEEQLDLVATVDRTLAGAELDCWVCGQTTTDDVAAERLDALRETLESRRRTRRELESTLESVEEQRAEIEEARRRKNRLQSEIATLRTDLEESRRELESKREHRESLEAEIDALQDEHEAANTDVSEELAAVESEIAVAERDLDQKRERLAEIEAEAERLGELEGTYETVRNEIESLRDRRHRTLTDLKDRFDEAIQEVIDTFDPGFERARLKPITDPDGSIEDFELVIAREGREARLDALSAGEVELVGIVTALAGYAAFDVADRVPLLLLDGIGQLTRRHIHALVEYLSGDATFLVTTAYPEAGDFDGHTVSPAEWEVVSDLQAST